MQPVVMTAFLPIWPASPVEAWACIETYVFFMPPLLSEKHNI
jgi:hypothetical protein